MTMFALGFVLGVIVPPLILLLLGFVLAMMVSPTGADSE